MHERYIDDLDFASTLPWHRLLHTARNGLCSKGLYTLKDHYYYGPCVPDLLLSLSIHSSCHPISLSSLLIHSVCLLYHNLSLFLSLSFSIRHSQIFLWHVVQVITPSLFLSHSISLIFLNLPAQSEVRISFSLSLINLLHLPFF